MGHITSKAYEIEIRDLAELITREAQESHRELADVMHETLDDHLWTIYTYLAQQVVALSRNSIDAAQDAGLVFLNNPQFDEQRAYYAMQADVYEAIDRLGLSEEEEGE